MLRARIVLFLFLVPTVLVGQEAPTLTEAEFLAAVTEAHPAAVALAGERELAAAEAVRASLLPNPAIEAVVEELPDARETTAGVTWTPPLARTLRREVAERGLAAAEGRVEAARLRLRLDLRETYADWAFAWERRELLAAHLARVGELAERARARAGAGEIPGLAARRFTLEEAQARTDLGRADARLAAARAALTAWYPAIAGIAQDARPAALPLPAAAGAAPEIALRPDLVAREREVERAEALRRLSGRIFAAPSLGLGWKRVEDRSTEASGPVVSAGWTVPLFDRRQADRQEAEARLTTARAELELARVRAQAERAGALAAFDLLRNEAAEADRAAAETAGLLTGASASYQLGESGLTDLLDTLRAALAARIAALEVREAAVDAQRDLEAAVGRPLPGDQAATGRPLTGDLP
jgi:outer membrane protein TolC